MISFNICGGRTWSAFATSWGTAGAGAAGFVTGGELIIISLYLFLKFIRNF
jgi:hypothetical protein